MNNEDRISAIERRFEREEYHGREEVLWLIAELRAALTEAESVAKDYLKTRIALAEVKTALQPLATLNVPAKTQYNAGAYSIRFSDIARAKRLVGAQPTPPAEVTDVGNPLGFADQRAYQKK